MPLIAKLVPRRKRTWIEIIAAEGGSIRLPAQHVPLGLCAGDTVNGDEWARLTSAAAYYGLFDRALSMLARREHFADELRRKLFFRERERELVERVVAACRGRGYLDDRRAAQYLVGALLARGGVGRAKLKAELLRRGCPRGLADETVDELAAGLDEAAEMRRLLAARRGHFASQLAALRRKKGAGGGRPGKVEQEFRRKAGAAVIRYLAGRGFGGEDAWLAAARLIDELLSEECGAEVQSGRQEDGGHRGPPHEHGVPPHRTDG